MSPARRRTGWILVVLSLLLHLLTVLCFSLQPDRLAAFTVMPIWFWGGIGLLFSTVAFYFMRASLSLVLTAIWALTLLVGADEARVLGNLGKSAPRPGPAEPHRSRQVIRVLTINTGMFGFGDPSADIAKWEPDIILVQQTHPSDIAKMAAQIYGGSGDFRTQHFTGIITRWKIIREHRNHLIRSQQAAIQLPDGSHFEVVNLHLSTAATDLRLWNRSAWRNHTANRRHRRQELSVALQILSQTTHFPTAPVILGGDFNAPASDVVHRQLNHDFLDAFTEAGTGWGNTFHRRLPILRIDHIYATRHFTPIRCRAVETRHSDHRFVVADLIVH